MAKSGSKLPHSIRRQIQKDRALTEPLKTKPGLEPPDDELFPPPGHTHPMWKRVLLIVAGVLLLLVGTVGWLTPIVTGIPFYVAGFILLAMASHRIRRAINWLDRKLPVRARIALRHGRDRMHGLRDRLHARRKGGR